jgi:hypothetical protein
VNPERPHLVPVSPKMGGRGPVTFRSRAAVVTLVVAALAFVAGLQFSPVRVVGPQLTASPSAQGSVAATPLASPVPSPTYVSPPSPLPAGFYHVGPSLANEIAIGARFYTAYNAGQLDAVMALLSDQPQLIDCDYATDSTLTVVGRTAIAAYFRARFADHD